MPEEPLNPNPIVAQAMKIRARRELGDAIDAATPQSAGPPAAPGSDAANRLDAFGRAVAEGAKRLNAILGPDGVTFVRLERPLRLRLRFRGKRVALDADDARQLVVVRGLDLDGDYQFDAGDSPALIGISKLSTEAGYGDALTPSSLLKTIAQDAELPRPAHLDGLGPLQL